MKVQNRRQTVNSGEINTSNLEIEQKRQQEVFILCNHTMTLPYR